MHACTYAHTHARTHLRIHTHTHIHPHSGVDSISVYFFFFFFYYYFVISVYFSCIPVYFGIGIFRCISSFRHATPAYHLGVLGVFRYLYIPVYFGVFQLHSSVFWCIPVYFGIYTHWVRQGCMSQITKPLRLPRLTKVDRQRFARKGRGV